VAGLCVVLWEGGREGGLEGREGQGPKSRLCARGQSKARKKQANKQAKTRCPLSLYLCVLSVPLCVWVCACNVCISRTQSKKLASAPSSLPRDNALLLFLIAPPSLLLPTPPTTHNHNTGSNSKMTKLFTVICHKLKPTDLLMVARQGREGGKEGGREGRMHDALLAFTCCT